jgi:hypothetical protein
MHRVRPRPGSIRLLRAVGVLAMAALVIAGLVAAPTTQASTPAVAGYRDFGYGGSQATRVTSDPEQSKLWYNDGAWWGGLFVSSGRGSGGSHFNIFRFNSATHAWVDTTRQVDSRDHSHGDYLWDAAAKKLYVASSKSICDTVFDGAQPCNDQVRVYRFSYNAASATLAGKYTLDVGFPKILAGAGFTGPNFTGGGSNAITIAKDSVGGVWVAYTRDDPRTAGDAACAAPPCPNFRSNVWLSHSTDGTTFPAATRFATAPDGQLNQDNTASVVAFGTKIGLYWTDKHASGASAAYFSVHNDGDPDGTWSSAETVTSGTNAIEDQANVKADSTGKVYVVAKTGVADQIRLFDRATDGTWTSHNVSTSGNGNTRAQVVIDEELGLAYVFSSSGGTTNGTIYVKAAPLSTLAFPTGKGSVFIQSTLDPSIDDVSLTKQTVGSATGIVAEASDRSTFTFLHGEMALSATDVTAPTGSVTIAAGAAFTAADNVTLSVPATDAGSGVALVRVANAATVDGNGVLNDAGATTSTWAPTVPWTLAAGDGPKTVYAQFRDSAGNWSVPVSDAITLDQTGPAGAVSINAGAAFTNTSAVTLDVTATDAGVGTVSFVRIANVGTTSAGVLTDPSAVTLPYAATKPWTLPAGEGSKSVYVQWQDALGNWSGVANDAITVDTVAPTAGTVSIDEGTTTNDASIHLTLTNPGGAAKVRIAESVAGLASATPQAYAASIPFTLAAGLDGTRTVYVQWLDDAGNASPSASDSVVLDLRNPVGTVSINAPTDTGVHSQIVSLLFPNSDTDIDQITVSNNASMAGSQTFGTLGTPFTGSVVWPLAAPLTNGTTKHVYVTFHDLAGNVSDPLPSVAYSATDSALVDLVRPVIKGTARGTWSAPTWLTGTAIPLRVVWPAATDAGTGVGSYRVWMSRDGAAYTYLGSTGSLSWTVLTGAGHTYRFRVYPMDRAGLAGNSLYTPAMKVLAYQDSSASVRYSTGWGKSTSTSYYGGTARVSIKKGATATLTFSGRSVSWLAAVGPTRGQARVYVDGRLISTPNLYSTTGAARRVAFARSWTSVGTHTIRIVVVGTAGHPRVDLDSFFVLR